MTQHACLWICACMRPLSIAVKTRAAHGVQMHGHPTGSRDLSLRHALRDSAAREHLADRAFTSVRKQATLVLGLIKISLWALA